MHIKKCAACGSPRTKRNGNFRGTQRYRCNGCGVQFVHDTRVSPATLWHAFAHEHATVPVLAKRYRIDERTVRRKLDEFELPVITPAPRIMVAVIDATRVGSSWILAVRDPARRETVYAHEVSVESTSAYQMAHRELTMQGFTFSAIVTDGRFVDVDWLFPGIPLQMCHFHQEQIVIRYLTLNPKLEAGIELACTPEMEKEAVRIFQFNIKDYGKSKRIQERAEVHCRALSY